MPRPMISKTEQLAESVPVCRQGDVAPKGLGRPGNEPLMKIPRGACVCALPDRNTDWDNLRSLSYT